MGRRKKTDAQSVSSQHNPRQVGEILNEMLSMREPAGEQEPMQLSVNTDISVTLKTRLFSDRQMRGGKYYRGSLCKDPSCGFKSLTGMAAKDGTLIPPAAAMDNHYTFTEHVQRPVKRYPHVYQGAVITMTQKDDGSLQPHFKPAPRNMSESSYKKYSWLVRDELMEAYKIAEANKKAKDEKKGFAEEAAPYLW